MRKPIVATSCLLLFCAGKRRLTGTSDPGRTGGRRGTKTPRLPGVEDRCCDERGASMVLIESAMRRLGNQMVGKLLLTFKEKPSFEGELSVALMEEHDPEGRARYFLVCQKEPPFNTEEIVLIAAREGIVDDQHDELMKSISWQREVPAAEASAILDILQHQIAFIIPEATIGLDGTTYELLIERGFSKVQFTWWCDPPLGWKASEK
jgi:hypothetical protein